MAEGQHLLGRQEARGSLPSTSRQGEGGEQKGEMPEEGARGQEETLQTTDGPSSACEPAQHLETVLQVLVVHS